MQAGARARDTRAQARGVGVRRPSRAGGAMGAGQQVQQGGRPCVAAALPAAGCRAVGIAVQPQCLLQESPPPGSPVSVLSICPMAKTDAHKCPRRAWRESRRRRPRAACRAQRSPGDPQPAPKRIATRRVQPSGHRAVTLDPAVTLDDTPARAEVHHSRTTPSANFTAPVVSFSAQICWLRSPSELWRPLPSSALDWSCSVPP